MLEIKNLSYILNKPLFQNLSFHLETQEKLAIIGPSGLGKTTLAKIICGHLSPFEGQVILEGRDVTGKPNRQMILVDQEDDLYPWLNVYKQLHSFNSDKKTIDEILRLVELDSYKRLYPRELSGGMKKRLSIARAFALNPKLIIFDESFSSLDQALIQRLMEKIVAFTTRRSIGMIFISHNLEVLEKFMDKKITLKNFSSKD